MFVECIICTGRGREREDSEMIVTDCGHFACGTCWKSWVSVADYCPSCNVKIQKDMIQIPPLQLGNHSTNNSGAKGKSIFLLVLY